ncbi:MAG: hypothetical protein WD139_16165 [Balneolaceae bacterium]
MYYIISILSLLSLYESLYFLSLSLFQQYDTTLRVSEKKVYVGS